MRTIVVTGSAGLIGSETIKRFAKEGAHVVGIDNDMRTQFFGAEASTKQIRDDLIAKVPGYDHYDLDIGTLPQSQTYSNVLAERSMRFVHTASQPSHD